MSKGSFLLLPVVLASALASAQMGAVSGQPKPDIQNAFVGSSLTCSQTQSHTFVVPAPLLEKARIKARLLVLLRDSLYDDAKGIVNIARENEIKKLANKLKNARTE